MEKPQRSIYTPQDFLEWRENGTLDLTPKFQRRGVWTLAARSFFIDSLLRSMPVPPIYIRLTQSPEKTKVLRQVIDGQQRIAAVLDFVDGKFRLSSVLPSDWAGRTYGQLSEDEKQRINDYSFSSEIFRGISDLQVLEIFARLNTYSVPLNAQELRNGRYFGLFKQTVYALAYEHLEFWRLQKIFTERNIARMLEAELTSELLIAGLAGMQDKKKSIDAFYKTYDEEFNGRDRAAKRFREVIDVVNDTFSETLGETEFSRPPLFYTLFCAIYHWQYGLPKTELRTPRKHVTKEVRLSLFEVTQKLSELISAGRSGESVPDKYDAFVTACLRQTDNIRPRQTRLRVLYNQAFRGA